MYNVAISSYVKLFSIYYKVILNVQSLKTTSFFEIMFIRTIKKLIATSNLFKFNENVTI